VLEALASGVPVVVSQGEPFSEYLDDGCASFVDPTSVAAIASALERLLDSDRLCAERAVAGRKRAQQFSWERVAVEHEGLYGELARTRNHGLSAARRGLVAEGLIHA
jgi:glycosyltransferase involved in cell wall biosynthesis